MEDAYGVKTAVVPVSVMLAAVVLVTVQETVQPKEHPITVAVY
jgi:hypothetical protein